MSVCREFEGRGETHVDEMLVLRLKIELRVESGQLQALADAEDALLAHSVEQRVVFRLVPHAGRVATPHAARHARVSTMTR